MKDAEECIWERRCKEILERTKERTNVQRQETMWIHSRNTKYYVLGGASMEE